MCPPKQDKLSLLLLNLLTLTTELIERLDSIKSSRMNSVFKTNGPKQIKSALHLRLFSFSKIQEISAYPQWQSRCEKSPAMTFKAQRSCHPFKINSQLFHCLEPYTDTDRVLAEAHPDKDQLSYAVRIVWRPSWLLPHLKKKRKSQWLTAKKLHESFLDWVPELYMCFKLHYNTVQQRNMQKFSTWSEG